ncbi:hypothetical protein L0Z72_13010 [candidate division KSB1 bacterium]|nr:hypothetical protein [candidate division KSB1 bacterium]
MVLWFVIGLCIILFFGFPLFVLHIVKKTRKPEGEAIKPDAYAEVKASLLFLQMAFPAILFLIGALGYGTYELIVKKVTDSVEAKVNVLIEKEKIVAWTKEIEDYREKAESDANLLASISTMAQDSIGKIVDKSFLKLLPKGTIIPFRGNQSEIDAEYWAICDGTKGTPNLKDRFILGGTFAQQGSRGGASNHIHNASTVPQGQVDKRKPLEFKHYDGSAKEFPVERHDHLFKGKESPVTVIKSEHLPPYFQLVFLMKIK